MTPEAIPEPILEPDLPIVDPHQHLWVQQRSVLEAMKCIDDQGADVLRIYGPRVRYLLDDYIADATAGHDIRASVLVETHTMYRTHGPQQLRSVGEVEFMNGMAAMAASGLLTDVKVGAGIVGSVDLRLGSVAQEVLEAHLRAAGDRYRGVRPPGTFFDPNLHVFSQAFGAKPGALRDPNFRDGFKLLGPLHLSCDIYVLEPQLPEVVDLARSFPGTQIILNHAGSPLGIGPYAGTHEQRFPIWRDNLRDLAKSANVAVKLGGLACPYVGLPCSDRTKFPANSEDMARDFRPYLETCIELFGVDRCMFEGNYPVEGVSATYTSIWNAFKRVVSGASREEKCALFHDTSARIYRLAV
jgi:predicted TIM-barrel fold metal-dependent hydrolase